MGDFTKTTNFTAKDALLTGDPNKVIKGSEHDTEFDNIATASATKANKVVSGTTNAVITQTASGDLADGSLTLPTGALVGISDTQTLTNKSIDSDNNTITNLVNADIKAAAAIDAAKVANGTVSNTEYQYLNGVSSAIQTQLDGKAATSHSHTLSNISDSGALAALDSVPAGQIDANSVGASELKTAIGTTGTQTILASATWTPSAGYYNVTNDTGLGNATFQIRVSSIWYDSGITIGGFFWCDGTNMRFLETTGNNTSIQWQKLG